jgi:uncharacterized repeat protein (TIGR03803 family)
MPGASVTTIASFPTSTGNGNEPDGQLFIDSNGDLLGATVHGGASGIGTTYEIAKIAGGYATTPTFLADIPTGLNTLLGVQNLSADANGDLFGLEITGGTNSAGTIVEFPAGGGAATTLANFAGGAGGSGPGGKLLVDASGNLFGFTSSGGAHSAGTVFELKSGNSTPTILTSFTSGVVPFGSSNLVEDAAGDLFGTTTSSVFEVQKTGPSSYAAPVSLGPIPGGAGGIGNLTIDANGDIFGTTVTGGANGDGSVFEITAGSGAAVTIASFTPADGGLTLNHPKTLIVDANGDLFGTTDPSAQNSGGVVYEIVKTTNGYNSTPTIVVNFNGTGESGLGANLVADANGDFFGTTQTGGANNKGTVFEIAGSGFAPPGAPTNFSVLDTTTNTPFQTNGTPYSGPVAGLQWEFIDPITDNLNVTANVPNVFIHTGSGFDAIDVSQVGGTNVLDGGTNSNFLVGGTGAGSNDTFFVDDRGPSADIWSTVSNFHAGDSATVFGITKTGFNTSFVDGQGAAGFTGLTLHVTAAGHPTASLTLAGFSTADLSSGRISTSFGTEADGTPYLFVHANS